ncbi:MAG: sodium-dependent transporter [Desulfovibrio sp.]|jgi:NSS family neurotransmitter:Na+ symporter|nr:sodium-dependent transporter [Desulfovibrio sp.]
MPDSSKPREEWGSSLGFILAAAASAIGLGNVWRFPYLVGKDGGAAFLLVYVVIALIIGLPVLLAEMAVGRAAKRAPVFAFAALKVNPLWAVIGWMATISGGFLVVSYYNVIGGWTQKYAMESLISLMEACTTPEGSTAFFMAFIGMPNQVVLFQFLFMGAVILIVSGGVGKGIERCCKFMMPLLLAIMLCLIVRAVTLPGAGAGLEFYLKPDWNRLLDSTIYLDALGQCFLSLSLGLGIMLTYGSYTNSEEHLPAAGLWTASLDTLAAFLAGFAIFPAVFAMGFEPNAGIGLSFITLPTVFSKMPAGSLFSFLFFMLLFLAAVTSAASLFEVAVAFTMERFHISRTRAVCLAGLIVLLLGGYSALSLSGPPKVTLFDKSKDFLDALDHLCNNMMLPAGSFLLCIFTGWVWRSGAIREITNDGKVPFALCKVWIWSLRYLAPTAIACIFIAGMSW